MSNNLRSYGSELPPGFVLTREEPEPTREQVPRQESLGKSYGSELPPGFVVTPREDAPTAREEPAVREESGAPMSQREQREARGEEGEGFFEGIGRSIKELYTGERQITPEMEKIPELMNSGIFHGENQAKVAMILPALMTATDPEEIAKIVQHTFPHIKTVYKPDAEGNKYPLLYNNRNKVGGIPNKPGMTGMDWLQTGALGVAFTPAGKVGTAVGSGLVKGALKAGGAAAATQAAIEGVHKAAGGKFDEGEVMLAGVLGGAGRVAEEAIAAPISAIKRHRAGTISQADQEFMDFARSQGIEPSTSDLIDPKNFITKNVLSTAEKIPFIGTGEKQEIKQLVREDVLNKIMDEYGNFSHKALVESMKASKDEALKSAGAVIDYSVKKLDETGRMPIVRTRRNMHKVKKILEEKGFLRDDEPGIQLKRVIDTIGEADQNFSKVKHNRTAFFEKLDSVDPAIRSQLTSEDKALLSTVGRAMTEDMRNWARRNLPPREYRAWRKANNAYGDVAKVVKKSKIKTILDKGDITPEVVETMMLSKKPSEVKAFYDFLDDAGKKHVKSAIISTVINRQKTHVGGITPTSFTNDMQKNMGLQIDTFFKGEEKKRLKGYLNLLDKTRRAQAAAADPKTGQALFTFAGASAFMANPMATIGGASGVSAIAHIYEHPKVRDALLKLGSVPRGSIRFDKLAEEAAAAIQTAIQATRPEE